jgi:hypothetical protein
MIEKGIASEPRNDYAMTLTTGGRLKPGNPYCVSEIDVPIPDIQGVKFVVCCLCLREMVEERESRRGSADAAAKADRGCRNREERVR